MHLYYTPNRTPVQGTISSFVLSHLQGGILSSVICDAEQFFPLFIRAGGLLVFPCDDKRNV